MRNIAVVIPTIRPDSFKVFMKAWKPLFEKHLVQLVVVHDGKEPRVEHNDLLLSGNDIMGEYSDVLFNFNAGIRNLGFAYVAKYLEDVEYIITLDDDEVPIDDTIQDHVNALNKRVPVSWISTAVDDYTRGFPYGIRQEAEVVVSHGVWYGVADWDAPTQLVRGSHYPIKFYRGPIPKGVYYPMCSMNLAFKRKMLPYIYHAPWYKGVNRFDDIFAGVMSKREIDKNGWAVVTGYAAVLHERASNVFKNLQDEALGIKLNETFWMTDGNAEDHEYYKVYFDKYARWKEFMKQCKI